MRWRSPRLPPALRPHPLTAAALRFGARAYFLGLFGWAAVRAVCGDRWWWLFLVNAVAAWLFAPLPLAGLVAALGRRRDLWLAAGAALALWGWLYGALWLPRPPRPAPVGPHLTVMTYNILGFNRRPDRVVAAIRASGADVVAFQELTPRVAAAIERDLGADYPYRVLAPDPGVLGLGVISRYPLRATGERLPGVWQQEPQVLALDFGGRPVILLNAHPDATDPGDRPAMGATIRLREGQARTIAAFVAAHPGPLLAPGDFNSPDGGVAYSIVAGTLRDSWREAGWGLGNTFPGASSSGSSRPRVLGVPVPMWLVRIDYVFHSSEWRAVAARIGPWDGVSDHRPVVVELVLLR